MGCLLAIIVRSILVFRYFPKTILGGVAVGAIVGLIIALVKEDWWIMLTSCAVGLVAGIVFELIIRLINRMDSRR